MKTADRKPGFREFFHERHIVLPVIHAETEQQVMRNVERARDAGADGVFIINHTIDWPSLLCIHKTATKAFPGWWIGVNCLGLSAFDVFRKIPGSMPGVWTDNALIDVTKEPQTQAEQVLSVIEESGWNGLYFGGVAFKYQDPVVDTGAAASVAARYIDVVTTSGSGTGIPAHVEKIRAMKEAIGDSPLALASGVTPENVELYMPYCDCFLVASGISETFDELDPGKLLALLAVVRGQDRQ